jgi:phosphoglucomutase/phosphomannomutase
MSTSEDLWQLVTRAEAEGKISNAAVRRLHHWLTEAPFAPYRDRLAREITEGNWSTLDDVFYTVMPFGTGGRRGRMYPVGTNALNERTIGESARGLADFITARKGPGAPRSCVIAHDTRHNSEHFARRCASVLAAAGVRAYVVKGPRSTPLLSFAVRHLGCDAGIVITASHNPPSDNGFKCYNAHGGQVVPPDDQEIIRHVEDVSELEVPEVPFERGVAEGQIVWVGPELDKAYVDAVVSESVSHARDVSIVYTPLHGVGASSVAAALKQAGFAKLDVLAEQSTPDGDFPTVPGHVANPELPRTLDLAIARAKEIGADLVMASDPDADRVGAAVPVTGDPKGEWVCLDGNQIGVLLTAFVIKQVEAAGKLRNDHYVISTLVSSPMAEAICRREGVRLENDLPVGFKWIATRIDEAGPAGFLFAFEESHGYQKGAHVRDKDAAGGSFLLAELAAEVKARKQTMLEFLDDLYIDVGHYAERQVTRLLEGRQGAQQIKTLMSAFREMPPTSLGGLPVLEVQDYKTREVRPVIAKGPTRLLEGETPSSDLLIFHTTDPATRLAARPSGTEPKIKFYLFARTDTGGITDRERLGPIKAATKARLDHMARDIEQFILAVLAADDRD